MWIDPNGNWHIINHAYSNLEYTNCATSVVSAHFFSADGLSWSYSAQPYRHIVVYDDGTQHAYTTLERPNLVIDATGRLTHMTLAADLVTGDEGCGARTDHAHFGVSSRAPRPAARAARHQPAHGARPQTESRQDTRRATTASGMI